MRKKEEDLIDVVRRGDIEGVKSLLKDKNINVNLQNHQGNTALIWAVLRGRTDIVKLLLGHENINVNLQNHQGNTALIWAVVKGNTELVKLLLEREIDINLQNHQGNTALIWAVLKGKTELVKCLIMHPDTNLEYIKQDANLRDKYSEILDQREILDKLLSGEVLDTKYDGDTQNIIHSYLNFMKIHKLKKYDQESIKQLQNNSKMNPWITEITEELHREIDNFNAISTYLLYELKKTPSVIPLSEMIQFSFHMIEFADNNVSFSLEKKNEFMSLYTNFKFSFNIELCLNKGKFLKTDGEELTKEEAALEIMKVNKLVLKDAIENISDENLINVRITCVKHHLTDLSSLQRIDFEDIFARFDTLIEKAEKAQDSMRKSYLMELPYPFEDADEEDFMPDLLKEVHEPHVDITDVEYDPMQ